MNKIRKALELLAARNVNIVNSLANINHSLAQLNDSVKKASPSRSASIKQSSSQCQKSQDKPRVRIMRLPWRLRLYSSWLCSRDRFLNASRCIKAAIVVLVCIIIIACNKNEWLEACSWEKRFIAACDQFRQQRVEVLGSLSNKLFFTISQARSLGVFRGERLSYYKWRQLKPNNRGN